MTVAPTFSGRDATVDRPLTRLISAMARGPRSRSALLEALRLGATCTGGATAYQQRFRWPIVRDVVEREGRHRLELQDDLVLEISTLSRIEQAALLSTARHPDHVWEPQTTRLLSLLSRGSGDVVVGGAYIGDQVIPIAHALRRAGDATTVHAFEPMAAAYAQLSRNVALNSLANVVTHLQALWDDAAASLALEGPPALARCVPSEPSAAIASTTIDGYVAERRLDRVGLIMLDLEGGEERALRGARSQLARTAESAPNLVFEVHRDYVDWSEGLSKTSPVALVASLGYTAYAVRDYHDNVAMAGRPIELVPVDSVYLDGPPHGFNLLATKDPDLVRRLDVAIVEGVSPKLLAHGDPRLHRPRH
jgi:FkbM family methyltransferase